MCLNIKDLVRVFLKVSVELFGKIECLEPEREGGRQRSEPLAAVSRRLSDV